MAVAQVYRLLWITGIVFGIFPHINLGLLSDYKICGDPECESLMSRVQAIRDHHGKDCRFLSFRQGDIIFVYHKLTGKREDLWAGMIDQRFGYFPKDAVQEEQVLATTEKLVETQRSDFFCMDDFGYPIDSSDLESDDENDDQKIQIQESESTQTIPSTDDTNTGSPSASVDPSPEFPVSAQQSDGAATTEGDENKNAGDAAAGPHEEAHENPAALDQQGGSPSSSWLGSSVTGWLGLGQEEESGNLAEEEEEDERKETQAKTSLTESVTGWLGFGGEGKPDDAVNSREDSEETGDSYTSTMTGWLGFGGETKTESAKNEQDGERKMEEEDEMKVTYRSRRMSLDLDGSQLNKEEEKEMGTLDWLGNGLSRTLGFGTNDQESGHETNAERESEETVEEEKEQSASGSWLGIGDILGFSKDESEVDERTEEDKTLGHKTGTEDVDSSQTQPAQTEEEKTEPHIQRLEEKLETETLEVGDNSIKSSSPNKDTSKSDEEGQDQVPQSETEAESATSAPVKDNSNNNNTDASDGGDVLPADAASKVDQNDVSPQTNLEEKSQAVGGMSSVTDEGRSAEMKRDGHQLSSAGNEGEDNNRDPGEEEIKSASDTDQLLTQSDINLGPEVLNSDSTGQSLVKVDEDEKDQLQSNQTDSGDEGGAEIMSDEIGASGNDGGGMRDCEGSDGETGVLHREISTTQTDESAEQSRGSGSGSAEESSGESLPFLSSGTAEQRNEPVHREDETAHSVKPDADSSDTLPVIDNNIEAEAAHGELGGEGEVRSSEGSSQESGLFDSTKRSTESLYEKPSEEDKGRFSPTQMENNGDQGVLSPQVMQTKIEGDAGKLKETEKNSENNLQQAQTEKETFGFEKDISTESGLKAAVGSEKETQTAEAEKSKEMENQEETEAQQNGKQDPSKEEEGIKEEEKQEEVEEEKQEEKQYEAEELREKEKQQEVKEIQEEGKQEDVEELKEERRQEELREVEEIKEKEKQGEMEMTKEKLENTEAKQDGKQDPLKEKERIKEEEKQEEVEEEKQEEKQYEAEELRGKEKQQEVKEIQEEGKREDVEELKEERRQEELREVGEIKEKQGEMEMTKEKLENTEAKQDRKQGELKEEEEIQEEEKQQEVEEEKQGEKQDETEELKEKEKQQGVKEIQEEVKQIKDDKRQEEPKEVEEIEVERKQEEMEEIKEKEKWEEMEGLKEKEEQEKVEELKGEKKKDGVEEAKEEKKEMEGLKEKEEQEKVEELKGEKKKDGVEEAKEEKKEVEEEMEELKEEKKQKETEEFEEKGNEEKASHLEVQMENSQDEISRPESESSERETHDENIKTEETQTEEEKREKEKKNQEKVEVVEEERKETEEMQQVSDVEGDRRDKEGEGGPECLNQLCPQATDDGSARDRDENVSEEGSSSADEGTIQTGSQNDPILADGTGDTSEGAEGDRIRQEGDGLEVEQTEDTDLPYPGESGLRDLTSEITLVQTEETRDDGQLYPDTETSSSGISTEKEPEQTHSDHETDTEDADVRRDEDADSQMRSNDDDAAGSESWREGGREPSATPQESVDSQGEAEDPPGPSPPSDERSKGAAETGHAGAFGLFKNAFSYFSQTPATEAKDPVDSALSLDPNAGGASQPQAPLTPEQELDSSADSGQVHERDVLGDSPVTVATEQPRPSPSSADIQTPAPSHSDPHTPSPNPETPLQTKTLSKYYKNLLAYMSVEEVALSMELFGRHKLQFLDYMLGSSETASEDPDHDESILSDMERLLRYHRETLVAAGARLTDAPQEDEEKARTLTALQQLEMLITRVRETFNTGKSDTSRGNHQAEASCVGASCPAHSKGQEVNTDEDSSKIEDPSVAPDNSRGDERLDVENDGQRRGKERETAKDKESEGASASRPLNHPQPPEGLMKQVLDFVHQIAEESAAHVGAVRGLLTWITVQVVSSLPDDIRPGPDLYGVPWEPVIITSLVGLVTMLLFTCRCYSSVKSRMYRSKERWMAEQVAQLLDEKCKVLETLSKCQQEYDDLEDSLRDSGVLAQTQKTEHLEVKARQLEHAKKGLERDLEQLKDQLDQQKGHRIEQERRIAVLEESMKTFEEESKELQSQDEQAQTTLKVYSMNSDRLQKNLETAGEENTLLQESNAQLRQQVEGWAERVSELEAEMRRCEVAHSGMQQDVANKDERIMSLTDRLLRMKAWESDLEEEEGEEGAEKETSNGAPGTEEENGRGDTQGHFQKVQKLIYAAKLNADLKSVDEDKDRVFAKLSDEVKAKEDLQVGIKELQSEKLSLQSDAEHYSDQVQRLQQKLQIMTEMYQENELKLHRLLTVEEKERLQKEEKLNKADKNIALAMEELNNYRQRAGEMEEELEKTKQSYQTQISAHEKKAHNNWLAARAADRDLADIRRENALLRQKLTDTQFKLDALDKDPYALDSLARPLPFRAERSPYGPSPLGRPASETRAFLSPPTLMDGPPARLSPRVCRASMEPPGGQGEMERSGGPHSDSGSISPTWERDRRGPPQGPLGPHGPLGPPGYMFPEPGGPMYRRPLPPPGALGLVPPPGSLPHPRGFPPAGPPGPPHPADIADGTYRENSLGPGEQEHREQSGPGDRRSPPEADPRMGGPSPPGPPVGPMDGPFPRRAPYGPPPPDFYPPRGPGGPPMMPMWAPPPPGMMFPPRFPPGGPPLPPAPHPHYAPPMRPLPPDGLPPPSMGPPPPQQSLPSPPHNQPPESSPEDAI